MVSLAIAPVDGSTAVFKDIGVKAGLTSES